MSTRRSVVKWFDAKKGYGFIVHPEGGNDIFVHYSSIDSEKRFKTLRTGQVVDFELEDGPKGLHAAEVVPADDGEQTELIQPETVSPPDFAEESERGYGTDAPSAGSVQATA